MRQQRPQHPCILKMPFSTCKVISRGLYEGKSETEGAVSPMPVSGKYLLIIDYSEDSFTHLKGYLIVAFVIIQIL
jgi:hypothetical protein